MINGKVNFSVLTLNTKMLVQKVNSILRDKIWNLMELFEYLLAQLAHRTINESERFKTYSQFKT